MNTLASSLKQLCSSHYASYLIASYAITFAVLIGGIIVSWRRFHRLNQNLPQKDQSHVSS